MDITIQSHRGPYTVFFENEIFEGLQKKPLNNCHFIVDEKLAKLYSKELEEILSSTSVIKIAANEENKKLENFSRYVQLLLKNGIRKNHKLIALGGGVIQDITAFLAATLFRGIEWEFFPTTLLSQADSCIGSKSSINVGNIKNILGTFRPPLEIHNSITVLKTLNETDIRSGIGEMIKVHIIESKKKFDEIAEQYDQILKFGKVMVNFIHQSLLIKKNLIEKDEFDIGVRNVMNYGHSFGHAIESATDFAIPHGIAVTMGMDMANFTSMHNKILNKSDYKRMHDILKRNWKNFEKNIIPLEKFLEAISRDKKNEGTKLTLILPDKNSIPKKEIIALDDHFTNSCKKWFKEFNEG